MGILVTIIHQQACKTNEKKAKKNLTSEATCFLLPGPQEVKLAVMDILLEIFLKSKIIFV